MKKLMLLKVLLVLLVFAFAAYAEYPMGNGRGGSNAGVYWPNQNANPETSNWVKEYEECSTLAYKQVQFEYQSVHNDVDFYRYDAFNNGVEDKFQNIYLDCIHSRGYPEVEY